MSKCRSCGRTIFWATTENGKAMPLDGTDPDGNVYVIKSGRGLLVFSSPRLGARPARTHWASCPNAQKHRGVPRPPAAQQLELGDDP